ncbi:MAG: hypothetical protein R3E33_02290 [Rhodocyclaceae bacterium]
MAALANKDGVKPSTVSIGKLLVRGFTRERSPRALATAIKTQQRIGIRHPARALIRARHRLLLRARQVVSVIADSILIRQGTTYVCSAYTLPGQV